MAFFLRGFSAFLLGIVRFWTKLFFALGACFLALNHFTAEFNTTEQTSAEKNTEFLFAGASRSPGLAEKKTRRKSSRILDRGIASFYGKRWTGRKTASGEIFNHNKYTAAHKTLTFGQYVRVVRTDNERSVVVKINDRGPFVKGRVIDLSTAGARRIGMIQEGLANVVVRRATEKEFRRQFK